MDGCPHKLLNPTKILLLKIFTRVQWPKQPLGSHAVPEGSLQTWIPHNEDIWEVVVGETVECMLEPSNFHDRNAVAIEKDGIIIAYLPQKVSHVRASLLKTGGTVRCTVTGRWYM